MIARVAVLELATPPNQTGCQSELSTTLGNSHDAFIKVDFFKSVAHRQKVQPRWRNIRRSLDFIDKVRFGLSSRQPHPPNDPATLPLMFFFYAVLLGNPTQSVWASSSLDPSGHEIPGLSQSFDDPFSQQE
jgi:hypothetical protein